MISFFFWKDTFCTFCTSVRLHLWKGAALCCSIFESIYMPMEMEYHQVFQTQRPVRYWSSISLETWTFKIALCITLKTTSIAITSSFPSNPTHCFTRPCCIRPDVHSHCFTQQNQKIHLLVQVLLYLGFSWGNPSNRHWNLCCQNSWNHGFRWLVSGRSCR